MGKFFKTDLKDKFKKKYVFDVAVSIHGKTPHTETYSMKIRDIKRAKELGYLNKNKTYLDWKPLKTGSKFEGGLYKVHHFSEDDRYLYAHKTKSSTPDFSLPKYLKKHIKANEILVGHRESNNYK